MTRLHDATHNAQRVTHFLGRILPSAISRGQRLVRAVGTSEGFQKRATRGQLSGSVILLHSAKRD